MRTNPSPGDRLKAWRAERALSQTEAGAKAEVSAATWCDWERGKKTPRGVHRDAIEVLTGIPGSAWNDVEDLEFLDRVRSRVGADPTASDFDVAPAPTLPATGTEG